MRNKGAAPSQWIRADRIDLSDWVVHFVHGRRLDDLPEEFLDGDLSEENSDARPLTSAKIGCSSGISTRLTTIK